MGVEKKPPLPVLPPPPCPLPQRGGGSRGGGAAIGVHALLDFYDVSPECLTDAAHLSFCLMDAARAADMTPLSEPVLHRFPGGGLTGFLPLAESHIAFHTYPEWGYIAADIFTCGVSAPEAAVGVLRVALRPGREQVRCLPRGEEIVAP